MSRAVFPPVDNLHLQKVPQSLGFHADVAFLIHREKSWVHVGNFKRLQQSNYELSDEMMRTRLPSSVAGVALRGAVSKGPVQLVHLSEGAYESLAAPARPLAGPSSPSALRNLSSLAPRSRLPVARSALVASQSRTSLRGYAEAAGGKFSRAKPHYKWVCRTSYLAPILTQVLQHRDHRSSCSTLMMMRSD